MDTDSVKEEIRQRVKIEDVVSQYVVLQRAGNRLKARCPFHEEKTPSFYVSPELGFWKCFGCGAGGDVFAFLMKIEGLTFPEAAERLAERVGLQWRSEPGDEARAQRRKLIRRANELAAEYFEGLLRVEAGRAGLAYLQERGFTEETIKGFRLGAAADSWDALLRHLRQKGIDDTISAEAGLAKERPSGGHYDVFRNRVIFPIIDVSGRVIGFGGRALDPEDPAKYLNTSDTAMFKKGRHVYALNLARPAIARGKSVVVVEGYTDVLSLHQAGIENVVACLGTALTQDHLDLLSRYAEEITLAYDADTAGMNAAARNVPMLEACSAQVRIVLLPEGLDPDDVVRQQGAEGFSGLLANRTSPVEYLIGLEFSQRIEQGPDGIALAARKAVDILVAVPDRVRMDFYIQRVLDHWGRGSPGRAMAIERPLREELDKRLSRGRRSSGPRAESPRDRQFIVETTSHLAAEVPRWAVRSERELVGAALKRADAASMILERLPPAEFLDEACRIIAGAIAEQLRAEGEYSGGAVVESLPEDDAAREVAMDLAIGDAGDTEEEVMTGLIAKLNAYRAGGRHEGTYVVPPDEEMEAPESVEDFEALRRLVVELLDAGEAPDHPKIQLYQMWTRRMHGAGRLSFVAATGDFSAGGAVTRGGQDVTTDGLEESARGPAEVEDAPVKEGS